MLAILLSLLIVIRDSEQYRIVSTSLSTICILHASHQKVPWKKWEIYCSKSEASKRFINQKLLFSYIVCIYVDNPLLNEFIVENTLSYLYNIGFSALRIKCFNNFCEFVKVTNMFRKFAVIPLPENFSESKVQVRNSKLRS